MQLFLPGRIIAQYDSITQILQLYKPFAPRCRAAARHFFTIHYSLFTIHYSLATRAQVCCLVRDSAPSSSSPRRRRGAPRGGGEEEALVQTKPVPCFYKMVLHYVASVCKFGTNLNAPCFSFRCRSFGAHVARYFFTLHSYFLLSRSGRGSWLAAQRPD